MASPYRPLTTFSYTQENPAAVWTIQHDMGDFPIVDVYISVDGAIKKVIPKTVAYLDSSNVRITFSDPQSGFVTLVA